MACPLQTSPFSSATQPLSQRGGSRHTLHRTFICDGCTLGKKQRTLFPQTFTFRAMRPLELIHCDICDLITSRTASGKRYLLFVVNDFSRYMWVESFLRTKVYVLCFIKEIKDNSGGREQVQVACNLDKLCRRVQF